MNIRSILKTSIFTLILLFLSIEIFTVHRKVIELRKSFRHRLKKYKKREMANLFIINKTLINRFTFPKELKEVPFADANLVLGIKNIEIRNVFAPYNPAIIENETGYSLFFRYDKILQMYAGSFNSYIGCAQLDKDFNQTAAEFVTINIDSQHAEDARIIKSSNEHYLIYNDALKKSRRVMHMANLDLSSHRIKSTIPLDLNLSSIEKNWAPFTYTGGGKEELFFEYCVSEPRLILKLNEDQTPSVYAKSTPFPNRWNKKWGSPLGGTQAHLVDGEYLAFFHSKFVDSLGIFWYVMGAYTFEAKPPFALTAMSPYPILFEGIYDSTHMNTADPHKCVIFPTGYALAKSEDREVIHLACGENDSTCKIITLDKNELLKSLSKTNEQ